VLQRYRLRLGDGTELIVDQDGHRAWLKDSRATVQVAGTQEWRPLRRFLADQESAARLKRALVPPTPRRAPEPPPPEVPPPSAPIERAIGEPSIVQALAEETGAPAASAPPWGDRGEVAGAAPVIRLTPLDDERPAPYEGRRTRASDVEEAEEDEEPRHDGREGPLLQLISTFGALLSRCLDPLTPLVRGWPSTSGEGPAGPAAESRLRLDEGAAVAPPRTARWKVLDRLTGWAAGMTGWLDRPAGRGRAEPLIPPGAPEARTPSAPAAREAVAPPVPVSELPVLRFAEVHEAREEEDVYEGEAAHRLFPTLWLWTQRVVLLGGLATGGVLAVVNWETWFPRAAEVGHTAFTEIDRQVTAGQRAREQEQALRNAAERLPHLAPATIRLVLSTGHGGVLEPPEVFQLATEAADRGQSALTPAEAAELLTLQRELLGHLRPPERARVAEYDRARAYRVVFPFENPPALELVARGARAMPAGSRERLQELLGKAVAAGLAPTVSSPQ
jgi:hypothetical protein